MALTIGVSPKGAFYVGDIKVTVEKVLTSMNFDVMVHAKSMNHLYRITDKRATEILPTVMVSAGHKGNLELVKLVIEAPRNVKILREKLYNKQVAQR